MVLLGTRTPEPWSAGAMDEQQPDGSILPQEAPVIRTIAMPADTNPEGDIFGGWLMSQMDLAGATVAFRLAKGRCATVAVDGMAFLNPVSVGDEVSMYARPTRIGRTSVQVAVEAWRRCCLGVV